MTSAHAALARIIGAVGEADFAAAAARAVGDYLGFALAAVLIHRPRTAPELLYDNFDAVGGRAGLQAYVAVTHRANPMLRRGSRGGALRACDFRTERSGIDGAFGEHLLDAPEEELGYRTVGWPEGLEEVGVYLEACGGVVELGLYRERGRCGVAANRLHPLAAMRAPLAAAFERSAALAPLARARSRLSDKLSRREAEVAELLLLGCSSEAIELRLRLARHTVKGYRKQIYRKLGVSSLAELFALDARARGHPSPGG